MQISADDLLPAITRAVIRSTRIGTLAGSSPLGLLPGEKGCAEAEHDPPEPGGLQALAQGEALQGEDESAGGNCMQENVGSAAHGTLNA